MIRLWAQSLTLSRYVVEQNLKSLHLGSISFQFQLAVPTPKNHLPSSFMNEILCKCSENLLRDAEDRSQVLRVGLCWLQLNVAKNPRIQDLPGGGVHFLAVMHSKFWQNVWHTISVQAWEDSDDEPRVHGERKERELKVQEVHYCRLAVEVWFEWLKLDSYRLVLMEVHLNESCEKKVFNF